MATEQELQFPDLLTTAGWRSFAARKGLSDRELTVLRQLCRGLRNDQIARALGIQLPTLRTHLRSIYQKMSCVGRTQALLIVIHDGAHAHLAH